MNHQAGGFHLLEQYLSPTLFHHYLKNTEDKVTHMGPRVGLHIRSILFRMSEIHGILLHFHVTLSQISELLDLSLSHLKQENPS